MLSGICYEILTRIPQINATEMLNMSFSNLNIGRLELGIQLTSYIEASMQEFCSFNKIGS